MSLDLWEKVWKTDPEYTKAFSRAGGFSGTAINATYLIRKATELWGPLGGKWGFKIEDSSFVPGANGDVIHVLQIWFRHPEGDFQTFGQTTFVGKNKNGSFTDEEAPKKSLTDALTKALSMLGFSADVHMGLFDDNKYVNDRRREEEAALPKPEPKKGIRIGASESSRVELTLERKQLVENVREQIKPFLERGEYEDALFIIDMAELDSDERVELGHGMDSKHRSALKEARKALEAAQQKETA